MILLLFSLFLGASAQCDTPVHSEVDFGLTPGITRIEGSDNFFVMHDDKDLIVYDVESNTQETVNTGTAFHGFDISGDGNTVVASRRESQGGEVKIFKKVSGSWTTHTINGPVDYSGYGVDSVISNDGNRLFVLQLGTIWQSEVFPTLTIYEYQEGYTEVTSGTCDAYITTLEECEAARTALEMSDQHVWSDSWEQYARGCVANAAGTAVNFNTKIDSARACGYNNYGCICKEGNWVQTAQIIEDTGVHPGVASGDISERGYWEFLKLSKDGSTLVISSTRFKSYAITYKFDPPARLNSGTCDTYITTAEECEAAGAALGLYDKNGDGANEVAQNNRATGCIYSPLYEAVMFNTDSNSINCGSEQFECVCGGNWKQAGDIILRSSAVYDIEQTAINGDGTVLALGSERIHNQGDAAADITFNQSLSVYTWDTNLYYTKSSGTCRTPITTVEECEAAAVELELPNTVITNSFHNSVVPSNCVKNANNVLFVNTAQSTTQCGAHGFTCICKGGWVKDDTIDHALSRIDGSIQSGSQCGIPGKEIITYESCQWAVDNGIKRSWEPAQGKTVITISTDKLPSGCALNTYANYEGNGLLAEQAYYNTMDNPTFYGGRVQGIYCLYRLLITYPTTKISINNDGNVLAVGHYKYSGENNADHNYGIDKVPNAGAVVVYMKMGNSWQNIAEFHGDHEDANLGNDVELSGDGKYIAISQTQDKVRMISLENCVCAAGKYYDNGECKDCPMEHYTDEVGQTVCKQCNVPYETSNADNTGCECYVGFYSDNNPWVTIEPGMEYKIGGTCEPSCPRGRYNRMDPSKMHNSGVNGDCNSCLQGKYTDEIGQTECKVCPSGYQFVGVIDIDPTWTGSNNKVGCEICPAGKYEENHECKRCDRRHYSDEAGQTECKSCILPNEKHTSDYTGCMCQNGFSGPNCEPSCPVGRYNSMDSNLNNPSDCDDCDSLGEYSDEIGLTACKTCAGVVILDGGDGIGCENVCTCSNGSPATGEACTTHDSEICASCDDGYYLSGDSCVENQCTCSHGTGATGTGCPNNGDAKCASCDAGYQLNGDACEEIDECATNPCVHGRCKDLVNDYECTCEICDDSLESLCDNSGGSNGFSGKNCDECAKGSGHNITSGKCEVCPGDYVNDQISHEATCALLSCDAGYGQTSDVNVQWDPTDTSDTSGNCVPCNNTVSPGGQGQCVACGTGYKPNGDNSACVCDTGYYLNGQSCDLKVCTCSDGTAATGTDCPNNGDAKCISCDAGYYLNGDKCDLKVCTCSHGTEATGTDCPNNGDAKCASCDTGYYLDGPPVIVQYDGQTYEACSGTLITVDKEGGNHNVHEGNKAWYATLSTDNFDDTAGLLTASPGQTRTFYCSAHPEKTFSITCPAQSYTPLGTTCVENQCTCSHGTGATGTDCPNNGAKCISCDDDYTLNGDICESSLCTINNIKCEHGTPNGRIGKCGCTCDRGYEGDLCDKRTKIFLRPETTCASVGTLCTRRRKQLKPTVICPNHRCTTDVCCEDMPAQTCQDTIDASSNFCTRVRRVNKADLSKACTRFPCSVRECCDAPTRGCKTGNHCNVGTFDIHDESKCFTCHERAKCHNNRCVCPTGFGGTKCDIRTSKGARQEKVLDIRTSFSGTSDIVKKQRQTAYKAFVKDIVRAKIAEGASVKDAIKENILPIAKVDLPTKTAAVITKTPAIAAVPDNSDQDDDCHLGASATNCGMVDLKDDRDNNQQTIVSVGDDIGSWAVVVDAGSIISKQTRTGEDTYDMQCWNGEWEAVEEKNSGDTIECNNRVIFIGSQIGICDETTCLNGGTCVASGSTFTCSCPMLWEGNLCEIPKTGGNNGTSATCAEAFDNADKIAFQNLNCACAYTC